jgi:TonB family protein
MKGYSTTLVLAAAVGVGCAADHGARKGGLAEGAREHRMAKRPSGPVEEPPAMELDNELGVLETADVEGTMSAHFDDIRGCYERAGRARKYAEGKVLLRFMVAGDGRATDVWVVESNLGNYDVERCLVETGRQITFKAPEGRKATTFDYPVEFRSTNELAVLDLDGPKVERDISAFLPQLAACGPASQNDVVAFMYIEPNGFPGSVGLASEAAIDEGAAGCIVQTIRRWKMSATLPKHALRCNFNIPPVIPNVEVATTRHGASSASARKRHR